MATEAAIQEAVDQNYEAFEKLLPDLLATHADEVALMRDEKLIALFENAGAAMAEGNRQFPDELFSIQVVTDRVIDLGFFSHVKHHGSI
jgi:hypothetical protein